MTREDVIRQIVERESRQQPLDEEAVTREAPQLLATALEDFGTWETALRYAGVGRQRRRRHELYSPQTVILRLRKWCCMGYDLSSQRNMIRDRQLYLAAKRHFGTWRKALQAAGIDLQHLRGFSKSMPHRRRCILRAIQARQEQGRSLAWRYVCLENRALALAAKSVFSGWRRALVAAESSHTEQLDPQYVRWTKAKIIAAIQRRHREGKSLRYYATHQEDGALVSAARRHFGGWQEAIKAAGFPAS
mgnify:CR=1 FL=1